MPFAIGNIVRRSHTGAVMSGPDVLTLVAVVGEPALERDAFAGRDEDRRLRRARRVAGAVHHARLRPRRDVLHAVDVSFEDRQAASGRIGEIRVLQFVGSYPRCRRRCR